MQPYTVFRPDPAKISAAGYASAKDLPVIFAGGTTYHADANEFLYERCLGYWPSKPVGQGPPVATSSASTYAHALANFLEYAETRRIDLATADYVRDILGRYQKEMLDGSWSDTGSPLQPTTANPRVSRACELLQWLSDKGRRSDFSVPRRDVVVQTGSSLDSHGHRSKTVSIRIGQAPIRPKTIAMPTDMQLGLWLSSVLEKFGKTVTLAVATVLHTALRKAELIGLRVDSIPRDPKDWVIVNPIAAPESQSILIEVRYGTKGKEYGWDNGDKIGPLRQILVPLELAWQIHSYVNQDRPRALRKLFDNFKGEELREKLADPHLFLDERTGTKLTYDRITHCWRNSPNLPFRGWCPHLGRHWWACMTLWRGIKEREAEIKAKGNSAGHHLILLGTQILQLEVQDQLGHLSIATTRRYILWVARQLSTALPKQYAEYMSQEEHAVERGSTAEQADGS